MDEGCSNWPTHHLLMEIGSKVRFDLGTSLSQIYIVCPEFTCCMSQIHMLYVPNSRVRNFIKHKRQWCGFVVDVGRKFGYGTWRYKDNAVYEGEWYDDMKQGSEILWFLDCGNRHFSDIFCLFCTLLVDILRFINSISCSSSNTTEYRQGRMTFPDGSLYEGQWNDGSVRVFLKVPLKVITLVLWLSLYWPVLLSLCWPVYLCSPYLCVNRYICVEWYLVLTVSLYWPVSL